MRAKSEWNKKISIGIIVILILIFIGVTKMNASGFGLGDSVSRKETVEKYDKIMNMSFSPDSKKLLFDRIRDDRPAMIHVYNLETGALSAYKPPQGEGWYEARYSFDGKRIAFSINPENRESGKLKQDLANSQIALMEPNGKNVRKITHTTGFKIYPSFSHDNKKVIFAKAGKLGQHMPGTFHDIPAIFYDVYEVDLEKEREYRLTRFKFDEISPPFYLPDDETIIFSAYGAPNEYPGIVEDDRKAIWKEKEKLYAKSIQGFGTINTSHWRGALRDNIYIVKKGQSELPEPLFRSKDNLYSPQITTKGMIYFKNPWDIYQYSPDGNHRRITNVIDRAKAIRSYSISPDGALLAIVVYDDADHEREKTKIVIYNANDGTIRREITLPDAPAPIINKE